MGGAPTPKETLEPLLWLVAVGLLVCVLAAIFSSLPAKARDYGQWEKTSPEVREWYQSLKQPGTNISCCGEADAYWCGALTTKDGKMFCEIEDERVIPHRPPRHGEVHEIPQDKILDKPNISGHVVVFIGYGNAVLCLALNGGV